MLKQVEPTMVEVDGMKFYIRPFPAFKAANISGELASVLAPLLSGVFALVDTGENQGEKTAENLLDQDASKAAEAIMGNAKIDGDKLEGLMKKLLLGGHISVEIEDEDTGKTEAVRMDQDVANEIFCGEVQNMFILCVKVIQLNFNGFFKKLAAQSGKAVSAARSQRPIIGNMASSITRGLMT